LGSMAHGRHVPNPGRDGKLELPRAELGATSKHTRRCAQWPWRHKLWRGASSLHQRMEGAVAEAKGLKERWVAGIMSTYNSPLKVPKQSRERASASATIWKQIYYSAGYWDRKGEVCLVAVNDVYFTHSEISRRFGSGAHEGLPIETLVDALERGAVNSEDLVLLAGRHNGRLYSINNRRLWALRKFQESRPKGEVVKVGVQVPRPLCPFTAKFIGAYSTTNNGESVRLRP